MSTHATLSPSGAHRWTACPGSVRLCEDLPDTAGRDADEGTDAHTLAARCLLNGADAARYLGETLPMGFVVDADMAEAVQRYVDTVRHLVVATNGGLLVEQEVPIGHITGEEGATGTADTVIAGRDELIVADLKFGRGVQVDAEGNPQLIMYALGAYYNFDVLGDFKRVRMMIVQPRLHHVSEWVQTIDEMGDHEARLKEAAQRTRSNSTILLPGEKQCRFCRAKATCPALRDEIISAFEDVSPESPHAELARVVGMAGRIEAWLKAIRGRVEGLLLAGETVPGYKLVAGKRGARRWVDEQRAEETLKAMRVKHDLMYDYNVISPTKAEKLASAGAIGPRQWPRLLELITQSEGSPSVAPESDKRPAIQPAVASVGDFDDVSETTNA